MSHLRLLHTRLTASLAAVALAVALALATGCSRKSNESPQPPKTNPQVTASENGHHHEAPHGGTLVELGEETAHLEIVHDEALGKLTVYVLDHDAQRGVRLSLASIAMQVHHDGEQCDLTLLPVANSLTGETTQSTSQYTATNPWLVGKSAFNIHVPTITVRGVEFSNVDCPFPAGNDKYADDHAEHHTH